jgi:hypothetical protein
VIHHYASRTIVFVFWSRSLIRYESVLEALSGRSLEK